MHSKIDGPAAYDILTNFEERWLRAAKPTGIKKFRSSYDDALLKIERISDIIPMSGAPSDGDDNPEAWHAQVFSQLVRNIFRFSVSDYLSHLHYFKKTIDCVYHGMQIFRSIDSSSVKGFPKEPKDASEKVNERVTIFFLDFDSPFFSPPYL